MQTLMAKGRKRISEIMLETINLRRSYRLSDDDDPDETMTDEDQDLESLESGEENEEGADDEEEESY
mgnify:CR=1 FL=1